MIDPGFEILNQRGTPMFFSDVFANRPTAGVVGRIFISTDTYAFYRDTGIGWDLIGGPGSGTITGTLTTNYITKATGTNTIGNSILYDQGTRVGINTITPQDTLDVNGKVAFQNIRIDGSNIDNTFIGRANWTNNTGTYNTFIGSGAGEDNTTGYAGTFLGYNSGNANTSGIANTFIGYQSGIINTTGTGNTFIGVDAGFKNISSNYNVIIGFHAGLYADVSENVIIGADSASANGFNGLGSVYVGYRTGFNSTTANYNTLIGSLAGFGVTTGDNLTLIGREAGQSITSGSDSTIIGYRAGFTQTIADRNTIIGAYAGFTNGSGNENTYVGFDSGFYITTGSNNFFGGHRSGYNLTTGSQNVFIGSLSGSNINQLVSCTNSIAIGYDVFTTASNQVVIGNTNITQTILRGAVNGGSFIPTSSTIPTNGMYLPTTNTIAWATNSAERMRLDASGNLGIATNSPTRTLTISGTMNVSTTNGTQPFLLLDTTTAYKGFSVDYSSSFVTQINFGVFGRFQYDGNDAGMTFANRSSSALANLRFVIDTTDRMRLLSTGNLIIQNGGTFTDSGQRLQVIGDTLMRGSGNTLATFGLTVQNSSSTNLFRQRNDGTIILGSVDEVNLFASDITTGNVATNGRAITFISAGGTGVGYQFHFRNSFTNTSQIGGTNGAINVTIGFAPTSGSGTFAQVALTPTINQTGGANGITRGLYVNPTLTAAADWRSIEWSNNSGWGLYGVGTAANFLSGNLLLGSATPFTANEKLQVTGTQQNKHAVTYSTGSIQSFRIQKDLTIGSGATISSASTLSNAVFTGDNIFGGNVTIPESSPFANVYGANYYQFNAAGITITQTQATGKRTLTQYYAQNYFKGVNSGTITDMSSIQIAGWYNNNTGSITPTITNAYQLLIADIGEYGHTFTLTNRWGIYQEGASDRNYMAGKLMLNTTTDTGQRIQINGDIRIDGQLSGTAGGNSGQHLIVNCDGTLYKIALLNV